MRVVQATLHDGRRDEHVDLTSRELLHHGLDLLGPHLAVRDAHARLGCGGDHAIERVVDGTHPVAHVVDLAATLHLATDGTAHDILVPLAHMHDDGTAVGRRSADERHVAHARQRHLQGTRDGRGRKREHVDAFAQILELLLVTDAKALLLVDDDES